VIYFLTLTAAILTENEPLIIRTARTTTIRERPNKFVFMGFGFRPIIGGNGNKSRGYFPIRLNTAKPLCRLGKNLYGKPLDTSPALP
jgi:hypothetical protein